MFFWFNKFTPQKRLIKKFERYVPRRIIKERELTVLLETHEHLFGDADYLNYILSFYSINLFSSAYPLLDPAFVTNKTYEKTDVNFNDSHICECPYLFGKDDKIFVKYVDFKRDKLHRINPQLFLEAAYKCKKRIINNIDKEWNSYLNTCNYINKLCNKNFKKECSKRTYTKDENKIFIDIIFYLISDISFYIASLEAKNDISATLALLELEYKKNPDSQPYNDSDDDDTSFVTPETKDNVRLYILNIPSKLTHIRSLGSKNCSVEMKINYGLSGYVDHEIGLFKFLQFLLLYRIVDGKGEFLYNESNGDVEINMINEKGDIEDIQFPFMFKSESGDFSTNFRKFMGDMIDTCIFPKSMKDNDIDPDIEFERVCSFQKGKRRKPDEQGFIHVTLQNFIILFF